ncbi:MAG: 1,4-dihydroxy-2-naphthoate polyprenyltransferase [Halobacteriales archaeon]|nr:1,4-dihydroxy-2-naphthoate polyprenyltransferase [Halobacteriales archaeon]
MSETAEVSRRDAWLMAARPHTLPAAAAPVIVGTGLAVGERVFVLLPALAALLGAALIQIGTNFANDYFDAVKGADTDDRQGFTRVTQSGILSPETVRRATVLTFGLAILVGVYLVYVGGLPILVIGLASVAAGVLYTGGPYPFGYYALGDLFVFVFFGLIAVTGTYYVQAAALLGSPFPLVPPPGTIPISAVLASLPMAAITTDILVVNNIRDRETDRAAGKVTLAVLIGYRGSRIEYVGLLGLAYLVPVWFVVGAAYDLTVLLPLVTLPLAGLVTWTVLRKTDGPTLNDALTRTGQLLFAYAVLFGLGLAI